MSKKNKVVATSNPVRVGGNPVVLCSDGAIRHVDSQKKGDDVGEYEPAVNKAGIALIRRALPVMLEIERLNGVLEKLKPVRCGEYGELMLKDDDGNPAIVVGCTRLSAKEAAEAAKALGLSLK